MILCTRKLETLSVVLPQTNYIAMDVLEQSDARTRTARFDFVTLSSLRKLVDGTCLVSVTSLDDYQQKKGTLLIPAC